MVSKLSFLFSPFWFLKISPKPRFDSVVIEGPAPMEESEGGEEVG